MLADDAAVDTVLSAENVRSTDRRRIHVNTASISAAMADTLTARCAEAGVGYVARPYSVAPPSPQQGNLNLMVAGPAEALDVGIPPRA